MYIITYYYYYFCPEMHLPEFQKFSQERVAGVTMYSKGTNLLTYNFNSVLMMTLSATHC